MDSCVFCDKLAAPDRLPADELVTKLEHALVLLGPWQLYQGYCIVVARRHATELNELSAAERHGYFDDMCRVAEAITNAFSPRKMNYELLGNQVPHLHWHLFPRYTGDPDVLQPVWLAINRAETDPAERRRLSDAKASRVKIASMLRSRLVG